MHNPTTEIAVTMYNNRPLLILVEIHKNTVTNLMNPQNMYMHAWHGIPLNFLKNKKGITISTPLIGIPIMQPIAIEINAGDKSKTIHKVHTHIIHAHHL